jgi:ferredoxin
MVTSTAKYVEKQGLAAWLEKMGETRRVLAPQKRGRATVFRPLAPGAEINLHGQATEPPKQAMLPRSEPLMRYRYEKSAENPDATELQLEELLPEGSTLLFGLRPCDARGFLIHDRVYDAGKGKDVYYCRRRKNTLVAVLACSEPAPTCFCHRVGSGPDDEEGADVLVTDLGDGYLMEGVNEKGDEFLAGSGLADGSARAGEAAEARAKVRGAMPEGPEMELLPEALNELFDDAEFWEKTAAKCLSCGACSYLCPTCYCFNITDEAKGNGGIRVRTWDNCMSFQFTLEGSGHNPRTAKAQRMRNRINHKFNFYPALHGRVACVGCGRCIANCPVSMDIRSIIDRAAERVEAREAE